MSHQTNTTIEERLAEEAEDIPLYKWLKLMKTAKDKTQMLKIRDTLVAKYIEIKKREMPE